MICPKCSSENIDGAKFCNECGGPLTKPSPEGTEYAAPPSDDAVSNADAATAVETQSEPSEGAALKDQPAGADAGRKPTAETSRLPEIKVPGVNVYSEDDEGDYDFGPIEEEAEAVLSDTSGIDEMLVGPGYTPPAPAWKSGDTMEMPRVEGEQPAKAKEFRAPDENAGKKRGVKGIVIAIIIAVIILAIGGAGASYYFELWGGKSIPKVVGSEKAAAVASLEGKGFTVRVTDVKSDDKEGTVLLADPAEGSRQQEGTEVVLHVAVSRTIPDLSGLTQEQAEKALAAEGYTNVEFVTEKSNEPEGSVLSVDPAAGTKANSQKFVTVKVAQAFTVPDVTGLTEANAAAALEAEGYHYWAVYVYSEATEGTVIATDPAPGSKLESGSTVNLSVAKSRGAELVNIAYAYLTGVKDAGQTLSIGGTTYELVSVDGVSYAGGNATTATITAAAVTMLDGEYVRASSKQRTITITWNDANELVSIS